MNKLIVIAITFFPLASWALPIDWHGKFGVDSSVINNYRFIEGTAATAVTPGSMEVAPVAGGHESSSVQTYVFSLMPEMIINDAATFKAEITSGYGKGGMLGRDTTTSDSTATGNTLFLNNESNGSNTLSLAQFYVELYSDLATYQIGRHSKQWGLGALYSAGNSLWDRHTFAYDGVTMNFKLDNFKISPFWARVATGNGLTRINHTKEWGVSLLYDNVDRDIAIGALYAKKQNGSQAVGYTGIDGVTPLGNNDVEVLDIYFKAVWDKLVLELEAPIISGELGLFYNSTTSSEFKANAILVQSSYQFSDALKVGIHLGTVSGDNAAETDKFSALYLNPNYRIANILFGYNQLAISDPNNNSYFDAYVTNTQFAALKANYISGKWTWDGAVIYAKANEVAHAGSKYFNHLKATVQTATIEQKDDLGIEFDLNGTYKWNNEISLNLNAGYLMAGDYFAFTNDAANPNTAANVYQIGMGLGIQF